MSVVLFYNANSCVRGSFAEPTVEHQPSLLVFCLCPHTPTGFIDRRLCSFKCPLVCVLEICTQVPFIHCTFSTSLICFLLVNRKVYYAFRLVVAASRIDYGQMKIVD